MDLTSIFMLFIAVIIGGPIVAAVVYMVKQNQAKQYALKVRPYPHVSDATRKLTDTEWNKLAESVPLVDIKDGPVSGMPVIDKQDLKKACEVLGLIVDTTYLSEVDGIHYAALRYPSKDSAGNKTPVQSPWSLGSYSATTRGARAASDTAAAPAANAPTGSVPQTGSPAPAAKTEGETPWYRLTEQERINRAQGGGATPRGSYGGYQRSAESEEREWWGGTRRDKPFQQHSFSPRAEMLRPPRTPKVLITPDAYKRMLLYVEFAPKEVGWLGTAKLLENGDVLIDMTYLIEQEVTAVETELSTEGQSKLCMDLMKKHGMAEGMKVVDALRFWGHSHVRMEVFPSSTDENTMITKGNDGHEWFIRGIFNKLGKAKFDIYRYDRNYRFLDVPWQVVDPQTMQPILTEEKRGFWAGVFSAAKARAAAEARIAAERAKAEAAKNAKPATAETAPEAAKAAETPAADATAAPAAGAETAEAPAASEGAATSEAPVVESTEATAAEAPAATTDSGADLSALVGETTAAEAPAADEAKEQQLLPVHEPHYLDALPDLLRPDAALRAEVKAEYDAKVDERTFRASFFKSYFDVTGDRSQKPELIDDRWVGDDAPGAQGTKSPDGATDAPAASQSESKGSATTSRRDDFPPNVELTAVVARVKQWFAKLFKPTPATAPAAPAPEKKEAVQAPSAAAADAPAAPAAPAPAAAEPAQKTDGKNDDANN